MKQIFVNTAAIVMFFMVACNTGTETRDSVEVAEQKNENRADSANMGERMEEDHEFVVSAASGGLMEVQLGEYASQNAASADVKSFGQMMVKDHSKANNELKTLASSKNIAIPSTPGQDHQEHIKNLTGKKGAEFDRDYMSMMVEDHEEDVRKFENAANNAKDPEIKAFAARQLPILRQHLQRAQSLNEKMK